MKCNRKKFQACTAYLLGYIMGTADKEGLDISGMSNELMRITNTDYGLTDNMIDDYAEAFQKLMFAIMKHDKTGNS